MAWVVRRRPALLRRGWAEKRMRGWMKTEAQIVAVSCGWWSWYKYFRASGVGWEAGVGGNGGGGGGGKRTIQMPAWAIMAVPVVFIVSVFVLIRVERMYDN